MHRWCMPRCCHSFPDGCCFECINCDGDIPCTDGACLVVAIVSRMVVALNAVAGHRAPRTSSDFPSARGGSRWLRSRGRSWGGIGKHWLHATLLGDPLNVVGDSSPHAWICRVG